MCSGVKNKVVTAVVAASLSLAGCATTGTQKLETVGDRIAQCAVVTGMFGVAGMAIANNTGDGDASKGAPPGVILGAVACAAWQVWDSQQDKMRIQQAQIEALRTQQPQRVEYRDGKQRQKVIQVSDITQVSDPRANSTPSVTSPGGAAASAPICYTMTTSLTSTGNEPAMLNPTYCDDGAGGFVQVA